MKKAAKFSDRIRAYRYQILLFAILLITVGVIYGNDLSILLNEALQNEACNYILLMPFFAAFLFYLKKDVVKATIRMEKKKNTNTKYFNELSGIVLCLIAFMIYWYGSYTFYPLEIHLLSLPIFVMGVILFLSNIRTLRVLLFPVLFLFFIVPIPSPIIYAAGGALANFNTQVAYSILKAGGLPLNLTTSYGAPTIILTTAAGQPANFSVDVACSGIYSLLAFLMFGAFLAFLLSAKITKKLAVFVLGLFAFAALNLLRITTIFSVSYVFGEETALIVHSFAGIVLLLAGMLLILFVSEKLFKNKIMAKPQLQPPCPACKTIQQHTKNFCKNCGRLLVNKTPPVSKTTLGKMLLLLLCCVIAIQSVQAPTFATAKNTVELSSATNDLQNSTSVLPQLPNYSLSFLYRDVEYEKVAGQDASLMYAYFPTNESQPVIYVDIGVAAAISNLHNWEVCLISYQTSQGQSPLVTQLESKDISLLQNPTLTAQYLVFKTPNPASTTQMTVYWYEKAPFKNDLSTQQKFVRISLIILTQDSTGYKKYEPELVAAAQLVAQAWEPLKNQAILSLGVPAQQALLAFLIVFLVVTQTAQYFSWQRKRSYMLKIFDNYASVKEKIVFDVFLKLSETNQNVRTRDIVEAVEARVKKPVNTNTVLAILRRLEDESFMHRAVASIGNSPVSIWKI
jgi:exosortase